MATTDRCLLYFPFALLALAIGVLLCRLRLQPQLNFGGGGVKPRQG